MKYRLESFILIPLAIALLVLDAKPSCADEAALVAECDAGNVAKCEDLVRVYAAGARANPVRWAAYAEKACNLDSGGACNNLGVAWSKGRNGAFQIDLAKGS